MKTMIVIDTDTEFKNRFQKRLAYNKLEKDYSLINVVPNTSLGIDSMIADVLEKVDSIIRKDKKNVVAFFVDIVVVEDGEIDDFGVRIAEKLSAIYPNILTFNVTGKLNFKRQLDIFSDAVLGNNDGVFSKYYLEGDYFNESRLNKILSVRKNKSYDNSLQYANKKNIDVAILTALHDDEFENIKPLFNWEDTIENETIVYHIGQTLCNNGMNINIIATHQHKKGIVDAAILSTEIINRFNPKYLIMTGVCGGREGDTNLGDIVVASELLLYQKGKQTEKGKQNEIDVCDIDTKLIQKIRENKKNITRFIKDNDPSRDYSNLSLHIEPMACGLLVVNKKGYFEKNISSMDRNIIAVDMESFSVARACLLSNDKKSKAIIIKSVMDKTSKKDDSAKPFAGYTSAQCASYLIKNILF